MYAISTSVWNVVYERFFVIFMVRGTLKQLYLKFYSIFLRSVNCVFILKHTAFELFSQLYQKTFKNTQNMGLKLTLVKTAKKAALSRLAQMNALLCGFLSSNRHQKPVQKVGALGQKFWSALCCCVIYRVPPK